MWDRNICSLIRLKKNNKRWSLLREYKSMNVYPSRLRPSVLKRSPIWYSPLHSKLSVYWSSSFLRKFWHHLQKKMASNPGESFLHTHFHKLYLKTSSFVTKTRLRTGQPKNLASISQRSKIFFFFSVYVCPVLVGEISCKDWTHIHRRSLPTKWSNTTRTQEIV